jgi:hypothetical protein
MDQVAFTNIASDTLDSSMLGYALPPAARTILNDVATGKVPLTVNTAEQFETVFASMGRGTSVTDAEKTALGAVRDALENTPCFAAAWQRLSSGSSGTKRFSVKHTRRRLG